MRSTKRPRVMVHLAVAVALVALISGCAPDERPSKRVSESPTTAPFATDEEALAAAQKTYEGYLGRSDDIMSEGGVNPERLDEFVTQEVGTVEKEGFEALAESGIRLEGRSFVDSIALQSYSPQSGVDVITAYICVDVGAVNVVDANGQSVVDDSRADRSTFEATFDLDGSTATGLRVSSNYAWAGEGVC